MVRTTLKQQIIYLLTLLAFSTNILFGQCLGKDYAIFFPVDDYVVETDLKYPTSEADTIAGILEKKYGFETKIVQEVTSISIKGELEKYREKVINDNDRLLIFFSGHGSEGGYFHPKDYYESYKTESTLSRDTLQAIIRRLPFAHTLVVMDACFGGGFLEDTRSNYTRQDTLNQLCKHFKKQSHLLMSPSNATEITSDNSLLAKRFVALLNDYADDNNILSAYDIWMDVSNRKITTPRFGSFISRNQVGSSFLFIPKSQKQQLKSTCAAFDKDCKLEKERCVSCPEDAYGNQYKMTKEGRDYWTTVHLLKDGTALLTWQEAKGACSSLKNGNWRLPTEKEWLDIAMKNGGGYYDLDGISEGDDNKGYWNIAQVISKQKLGFCTEDLRKKNEKRKRKKKECYKNINENISAYYWTASMQDFRAIYVQLDHQKKELIKGQENETSRMACVCIKKN